MSRPQDHPDPYAFGPALPCLAHAQAPAHQLPLAWRYAQDPYLFNRSSGSTDTLALHMWQLPPLDFLLPFHHDAMSPQEYFIPDLGFSPTPSDSSTISGDSEPSPAPEFTHVVCNAPLVAPVPLPYHSPTFLRYEDLPDEDEDLSHPPYTRRPQKRKREDAGADSQDSVPPTKRRSIVADFSRLQCGSRHPLARNVQVRGPPASGLRQGRPR